MSTDPLAQLVEHNTFNVGVLGSSPKRITKENPQESDIQILADSLFYLILLGRNFGSVDDEGNEKYM